MKRLIFYCLILLSSTFPTHAQWTDDPHNPLLVCNAVCRQQKVKMTNDGAGGVFVFWLDSRSGCSAGLNNEVYGQHIDSMGVAQWTPGGKRILNYTESITFFDVIRSETDGEIIIGCLVDPGDSLRFQKLDNLGNKLWPTDLLVSVRDGCQPPNYTLYITEFRFFRDDAGYVVATEVTYCGGANGHRVTRFNSNGTLTGPFNGTPEGNQSYSGAWGIDKTYDGTNDLYLFYTNGNGQGAHASLLRIGFAGDTIWGPVDVLSGTNGLNYHFSAKSDSSGIAVCYQSNGLVDQDLFLRRYTSSGNPDWAGITDTVCGANGSQIYPSWVQDDNFYYLYWADGRPGTLPGFYDIFAQKIEKSSGNQQWNDNGNEIFSQSTYSPYPGGVVNADEHLVILNEANITINGFNAMMVGPSGNMLWDTTVAVDLSGQLPFYDDYTISISGNNTIVAWAEANPSGGADGIYIARILPPAVNVYDTVTACNYYISYNDTFTVSGTYVQSIPPDTVYNLYLNIEYLDNTVVQTGDTLTAVQNSIQYSWMDCQTGILIPGASSQSFIPLTGGNYAVVVQNGGCIDTSICYNIIFTPIVSGIYQVGHIAPNPSKGIFTFKLPEHVLCGTIRMDIMDISGKIVFNHSTENASPVDVSFLQPGCYLVKIFCGADVFTERLLLSPKD